MASKKKSHKDVEFQVTADRGDRTFRTFEEALLAAATNSVAHGVWTGVYVIVYSEAGARWWGGDAAVEQYRSDPDASVFEKINVKVQSEGMIP